jgi:prepilin-type N-terminal cleavage/methylation domain-containing protein
MRNIFRSDSGLTLVEVLVSAAIIVILLTAAAVTIVNSQLLSSLARHKEQAAYAAQQILEQQRRVAFSNIVSRPAAAVILDTMGTYNTTQDDFIGSAVITVTNIDTYRKKVQVEINWPERVPAGGQITAREYYATTIANEPQLN